MCTFVAVVVVVVVVVVVYMYQQPPQGRGAVEGWCLGEGDGWHSSWKRAGEAPAPSVPTSVLRCPRGPPHPP